MHASWNNAVIAQSTGTVVVERNDCFPREGVDHQCLRASGPHNVCSWKGTASCFDGVVDGRVSKDAARYHPEPKAAASEIAGRIAFRKGVAVTSP